MILRSLFGMVVVLGLTACGEGVTAPPTVSAPISEVEEVSRIETVKVNDKIVMTPADVQCLAKNIYHEAGVEKRAGKIAVAQVTVNRLKSGKYGKSICKVVHAKAQFSWTLDKKLRNEKPKGELWKASMDIAKEFAKGIRAKNMANIDHYHTDYIRKPFWTKSKTAKLKVGQHIFYS